MRRLCGARPATHSWHLAHPSPSAPLPQSDVFSLAVCIYNLLLWGLVQPLDLDHPDPKGDCGLRFEQLQGEVHSKHACALEEMSNKLYKFLGDAAEPFVNLLRWVHRCGAGQPQLR